MTYQPLAFLLWELPANGCRWPVGTDEDDQHLFCGTVRRTGKSYCQAHHELAVWKSKAPTARRKPGFQAIKPMRRIDVRWIEGWRAPVKL